jgi:hypothetical protein
VVPQRRVRHNPRPRSRPAKAGAKQVTRRTLSSVPVSKAGRMARR